jgi:hypothetical protein
MAEDEIVANDRRANFYADMKAKYQRAARLPIAPDPPEPEWEQEDEEVALPFPTR